MKNKISRLLRLDRQSFLGPDSADVLDQCRVAVVGVGGGGSHVSQQLAHVGVGDFLLADPDKVEDTNLNRLVGATEEDVAKGSSKVLVAERLIRAVNPWARVSSFAERWQQRAVDLRSCDVIFGCVDSATDRDQLEKLARRYLIPYIDIGMDVHAIGSEFVIGGQVAASMPCGLCLWCLGIITEQGLAQEAQRYGDAGHRPQVVWPNGVLASAAVGLFVKLVTPWEKWPQFPILLEYNGNAQTLLPSSKLTFANEMHCSHFDGLDSLGDPFWQPLRPN